MILCPLLPAFCIFFQVSHNFMKHCSCSVFLSLIFSFSPFLSAHALFSWYFSGHIYSPPPGGGYFPIYRPLDLAECGWDLAKCGWDLAVCGWDLAECGWELAECRWDLAECGWDLAECGWDLAECGWDLAEWLERLGVNAKVLIVLGIQPSVDEI